MQRVDVVSFTPYLSAIRISPCEYLLFVFSLVLTIQQRAGVGRTSHLQSLGIQRGRSQRLLPQQSRDPHFLRTAFHPFPHRRLRPSRLLLAIIAEDGFAPITSVSHKVDSPRWNRRSIATARPPDQCSAKNWPIIITVYEFV